MRRRALLSTIYHNGGSKWAYELHLTPEWEVVLAFMKTADISGDFNELFNLLYEMTITLGEHDSYGSYLNEIPQECNITVDGIRLNSTSVMFNMNNSIEISFGDNIFGVIIPEKISLDYGF